MKAPESFLSALFALPQGTFTGTANSRCYVVTRQTMADGKSHKLEGRELGGKDYISMNLYLTRKGGALLRPCEMSACKVIDFVTSFSEDT